MRYKAWDLKDIPEQLCMGGQQRFQLMSLGNPYVRRLHFLQEDQD